MAKQVPRKAGLFLLLLVIAAAVPVAASPTSTDSVSSLIEGHQSEAKPTGSRSDGKALRTRGRKLEDEGYAEEYFEEEAEEAEAAQADGESVWFDDDKYKEYEVETRQTFWSMFNNPPASWTSKQWGFFAGVLTLFSIIFCCIVKVFCPCC